MLRDITLGQFYPANSVFHRLDPRVKLLGSLVYIILLFVANTPITYGLMTVVLVAMVIACKVPFSFMVRGLKAILILLIIAALFNLFLTPGAPIVSFWIFKITKLGIKNAILMVLRMTYLIIGTSILTLTTTPGKLTAGLEKGLHFLTYLKVPVHEIAMMMTIALRFIPLLMEETDRLMKAQLARGADFETGGPIKKAKALLPIIIPLFVSAFRRAGDLAQAMEARCYHGGDGRTRMEPLKYARRDIIGYVLMFLVVAGVITLRILF